MTTSAIGSDLSSKLQRFFWPAGHVNDTSAPWISQRSRTLLWWGLVAFAAVDIAYPIPALTGSWWCVFFVLWVTPWRRPVCSRVPHAQLITWLSSILLFSWLIYRTQSATRESVITWLVFESSPWLKLLSFPMQTTLAAIVTAAVIVIPLRRIVGERATVFAIIASLPYALISRASAVFVVSRWVEQPLANAIHLFDAVMPMLVIAEASSLLARFRIRIEGGPLYGRLRTYLVGLLMGKLHVGVALAAYGGLLVLAHWGQSWAAHDQILIESPAGLAICATVLPATAFILILAAIATWRSLARAGRRHVVIDNLAAFGRLIVLATAGGTTLWVLFVDAPRSGTLLSEAVQLVPGPAWSIEPTAAPGGLRLSGELQRGVSRAFADELARDSSVRRLELNGPGGYADEGYALANLVEKYALSTFVRRNCESACTKVFVAGRERVLAPGAKLGFHRPHSVFWPDMADADHEMIEYLKSKGVNEDFARKAVQVPHEEMWYPSEDELLAAGVISTAVAAAPNTTAVVRELASK